ncbi:MAG TPA: hypothetical protein DDZ51_05615 [Planctomycetaceae bacterium]|nr:hypothetical protein [Planctomycetaceae bacterium]
MSLSTCSIAQKRSACLLTLNRPLGSTTVRKAMRFLYLASSKNFSYGASLPQITKIAESRSS